MQGSNKLIQAYRKCLHTPSPDAMSVTRSKGKRKCKHLYTVSWQIYQIILGPQQSIHAPSDTGNFRIFILSIHSLFLDSFGSILNVHVLGYEAIRLKFLLSGLIVNLFIEITCCLWMYLLIRSFLICESVELCVAGIVYPYTPISWECFFRKLSSRTPLQKIDRTELSLFHFSS
jgi:hypothetical protein